MSEGKICLSEGSYELDIKYNLTNSMSFKQHLQNIAQSAQRFCTIFNDQVKNRKVKSIFKIIFGICKFVKRKLDNLTLYYDRYFNYSFFWGKSNLSYHVLSPSLIESLVYLTDDSIITFHCRLETDWHANSRQLTVTKSTSIF